MRDDGERVDRTGAAEMTSKLKLQIALLIFSTFAVGFTAGLYAASQFIGNFIEAAK